MPRFSILHEKQYIKMFSFSGSFHHAEGAIPKQAEQPGHLSPLAAMQCSEVTHACHPTELTRLFAEDFTQRQFKKAGSHRNYATDLLQWIGYLTEKQTPLGAPLKALPATANEDDRRLIGATSSDITDFMQELKERGSSDRTIKRKLASLASFYKFLLRSGYIERNPTLQVRRGERQESFTFKLPSEDQVMRLLASFDDSFGGQRTRALVHLIYETCAKPSELLLLHGRDVHLSSNDLDRSSYIEVGRLKTSRKLYLGPEVIGAVRKYLVARHVILAQLHRVAAEELLFINKHHEKISERSCRRELDGNLAVAGVDPTICFNDIRMSGLARRIRENGWRHDLIHEFNIPVEAYKKILRDMNITDSR